MITDKQSFRILQILPDRVICMTANGLKFIYRDYPNSEPIINHLTSLQSLSHPSLLNVKSINVAQNIGVYFQHYSGNLTQYLGSDTQEFSESEVLNTFKEILEVLEYMISQGVMPSIPKLQNIVVTQDQSIKFADDFLINQNKIYNNVTFSEEKTTPNQIYEGLLNIIFSASFPKYRKIGKSWKNKLKIIKQCYTQKTFNYFMSLYKKSGMNEIDEKKTKKILKKPKFEIHRKQIKVISQKHQKSIKQAKNRNFITSSMKHEGKQNKISQH